jgi:lipopolysaccharide export system protein LptA
MTARTMARLRDMLAALAIASMATGAGAQPTKPAPQPTPAPPNAFQGFSQNHDQPVKIESARLEVRDKDKRATFTGDVHVTQGDTVLTCRTLIVYYEQNAAPTAANPAPAKVATTQPAAGGGASQIRRLEAIGDVVVVQKDQTATGNKGDFDMKTNTMVLEGNVVVSQGPNVVRGERLVVDMTTGVSRVEPAKGSRGRVDALIVPGSAKEMPGSTKDAAKDAPKDTTKPPTGPMKLN